MNKLLLSIIVPVYNVEDYLDKCIESILDQDYSPIEILLINDGSTDSSGSICDDWQQRDGRIHVIHQTNQGLSAARNRGIALAKGEYITFVDSDDLLERDTLGPNMQIIRTNPLIELLEYPAYIYHGAPEQRVWQPEQEELLCGDISHKWFNQEGYAHSYAWNKIYKRTLFADNTMRFPEGEIFEDIYLMTQLIQRVNHYYLSQQGLYLYQAREGSISRENNSRQYWGLLKSYHYLYTHFLHNKEKYYQVKKIGLIILNWKIMLLRLQNDPKEIFSEQFRIEPIHLSELFSFSIPLKQKIKGIPFAILGEKSHCWIFKRIEK